MKKNAIGCKRTLVHIIFYVYSLLLVNASHDSLRLYTIAYVYS